MRNLLSLTFALIVAASALAQPATDAQRAGVTNPDGFGTMHLTTRLGSFRIIDGFGRAEVTFKGTVLLSKLKGHYEVSGAVHKEFEKNDRVIYSGNGKIVVTGEWRALHWFGSDLTAVWYGRGVIRLSGEFDRDQKTGEYWFDDPSKSQAWPGGTTQDVVNPPIQPGVNPNVKVKTKKG